MIWILVAILAAYSVAITCWGVSRSDVNVRDFVWRLLLEKKGPFSAVELQDIASLDYGVALSGNIYSVLRELERSGLVACEITPSDPDGPRGGRPTYRYQIKHRSERFKEAQ